MKEVLGWLLLFHHGRNAARGPGRMPLQPLVLAKTGQVEAKASPSKKLAAHTTDICVSCYAPISLEKSCFGSLLETQSPRLF